jgi:hypothetical protein
VGKKLPKKASKSPHKAKGPGKPPRRGAKGPVKGSKQPLKKDRRSDRIPDRPDLVGIKTVTVDSKGKHKGKVIEASRGLIVIQRDDDPAPSRLDYVQLDRFLDEHPGEINMRCGSWRQRTAG